MNKESLIRAINEKNDELALAIGGNDLDRIRSLSGGLMDVTVGSALTLFGGDLELADLAAYSKA